MHDPGGSGQYSAGQILNNSFHTGCIQPGVHGGISEEECDDFVVGRVTSPPPDPQEAHHNEHSGGSGPPSSWMPWGGLHQRSWPTVWARRPCLGVVLPDLVLLSKVAGTKLGPASSYSGVSQGAIV